jgi:membrane-associated phospholipid phosphatase
MPTAPSRGTKPLPEAADALLCADSKAAAALRPYRDSLPVRILEHVADLGDQPPMRILCGSVIAVGLVAGDRRLARAGLRMLAAHTLATLVKDAVKRQIDRTRPRSAAKPGKDARPRRGDSEAKEETSFPSGHSAGAAAVARAFARSYPEHAAPAYAAAAILALAQIPRCAHYPTDVGAGLAIGLAAEKAVDLAWSSIPEASLLLR